MLKTLSSKVVPLFLGAVLALLVVPVAQGGLGGAVDQVMDQLPIPPDSVPDPDESEDWDQDETGDGAPTDGPVREPPAVQTAREQLDAAGGQAEAASAAARQQVDAAVDQLMGQLPSDPVGYVHERLRPVRDTADDVQDTLFPTQAEVTEAPPATASITEVPLDAPSAVAATAAAAAAAAALAILWLAGSSGSVGAGAAGATGAGGKLAATDLRRLLPFASPLFTRFEKDTVLGHPKREALYALILQSPGVSLQSLCDSTGLSRTAVTHHLRLLELQHLIVSKRMGRSRHYYENGGRFGRDQKEALAVLQNQRSKDVAQFVKEHPGAIQKVLCTALGLQPSIAHWHLSRLQQAQLVESVRSGRTVSYFPGAGLRALDQPAIPATALLAAPTAV